MSSPNKRDCARQSQKCHEKIETEAKRQGMYPSTDINAEHKCEEASSRSKTEFKDAKRAPLAADHTTSTSLDQSGVREQLDSMAAVHSQNIPSRPSRRQRAVLSYAEPNLRHKMRRSTNELVDAVAGGGQRQVTEVHTNDAEDLMRTQAAAGNAAGQRAVTSPLSPEIDGPNSATPQQSLVCHTNKRPLTLSKSPSLVDDSENGHLQDSVDQVAAQKVSSPESETGAAGFEELALSAIPVKSPTEIFTSVSVTGKPSRRHSSRSRAAGRRSVS